MRHVSTPEVIAVAVIVAALTLSALAAVGVAVAKYIENKERS